MTLDEAIKHCKEKAADNRHEVLGNIMTAYAEVVRSGKIDNIESIDIDAVDLDCLKCAYEHDQLATWLTQLRCVKNLVSWYGAKDAYGTDTSAESLIEQIRKVVEADDKYYGTKESN